MDISIQKIHAQLTKLDGEFKGLRAQFTEFTKQARSQQGLTPAQAQSLRQEIATMRQDVAAARHQNQAMAALQQEHAAFQRELEALRQASRGTAKATEVQRELLAVRAQADALRGHGEALARRLDSAAGLEQEQASLRKYAEALSQRFQAAQAAQQEQQQLRTHTEMLAKRVQELGSMRGELQSIRQRQQEFGRLRDEMGSIRGSAGEVARKLGALEARLRSGLVLPGELDQLRGEVHELDALRSELRCLRDMLFDSGVLAQKPDPVEEHERRPVGSIELGEDIFTARLLLKLGFLKAKCDEEDMERRSFTETSDGGHDESTVDTLRFDDNVTGIQVPGVREGTPGYGLVTCGWALVCACTFLLQVFIVSVMMYYAKHVGDGCMMEAPRPFEWWLLHTSKAIATLVAGAVMGKELLDVLNYWMVSELLLGTQQSLETHISAGLRLLMIVLLAIANAYTFMYYSNPASVWINMTALAFISELGTTTLELAKRGVMGHDISKAITGLNFSLNFMSVYPWWFGYARFVALLVMSVFVLGIAGAVFHIEDHLCPGVHADDAGDARVGMGHPGAGGSKSHR